VDAARIDAHTLSLLVDTVWSKEVSIAADAVSGQLTMHVGATPVTATLNGRRRWGGRTKPPARLRAQRLVAPMPGKVVRVLESRRPRRRGAYAWTEIDDDRRHDRRREQRHDHRQAEAAYGEPRRGGA